MNKIAVSTIALSLMIGISPFVADEILIDKGEMTMQMNATVIEEGNVSLGIVSNQELRYGRIPAGAGVTKFLNVSSSKTTLMKLESTGNISEYLEHPEELLFEGRTSIRLHFNTTSDAESGLYEGELKLKTQSVKQKEGERWLQLKKSLSDLY